MISWLGIRCFCYCFALILFAPLSFFFPRKTSFFCRPCLFGGFFGTEFWRTLARTSGGLVGLFLVQNPISFCLKPHGEKFSPI